MKEITVRELSLNPFVSIGEEWCLIASSDEKGFNAMTASWGGLGVLWNKNVVSVYIRPQRFTKSKVDVSDRFTVAFFDKKYKKQLGIFGSKSGKDHDKEALCDFHVVEDGEYAYHKEAKLVLECKVVYHDRIRPECMLDDTIENHYPNKDYHDVYVGEIEKVLIESK